MNSFKLNIHKTDIGSCECCSIIMLLCSNDNMGWGDEDIMMV